MKQEQALVKTTCNEWLEKCKTPTEAIRNLEVRTIQDSLSLGTPTLAEVKRTKSRGYILGHIKIWLIYLQGNLNLKNKLSEDMIDLTAEMIYEDFPYLTLSDLRKVFTDALKGVYGEFYESISIPKVIGWFEQYANERAEICATMSLSEHNIIKNKPVDDLLQKIKEHESNL